MAAPARTGAHPNQGIERTDIMLWTIVVILLALWVLGLIGSIGGAAIHALLLIAGIIFVVQLLSGRRTVS
jgi:L-cystine uptake protein TcyP (sodium:dicarboxylate symporter family)